MSGLLRAWEVRISGNIGMATLGRRGAGGQKRRLAASEGFPSGLLGAHVTSHSSVENRQREALSEGNKNAIFKWYVRG